MVCWTESPEAKLWLVPRSTSSISMQQFPVSHAITQSVVICVSLRSLPLRQDASWSSYFQLRKFVWSTCLQAARVLPSISGLAEQCRRILYSFQRKICRDSLLCTCEPTAERDSMKVFLSVTKLLALSGLARPALEGAYILRIWDSYDGTFEYCINF